MSHDRPNFFCRSLPRSARRAREDARLARRGARRSRRRATCSDAAATQLLQRAGRRPAIAFLDRRCARWCGGADRGAAAAARLVSRHARGAGRPAADGSARSCRRAAASRSCGRWRRCWTPRRRDCSPMRARCPSGARASATAASAAARPWPRTPATVLVCTDPACAQRVLPAHRSGDHRAGERRRARAARAPGELAAAPLLDHRRLRRARREPGGCGGARGAGGNRRRGAQRALRLLAALAVPLLADARLLRERRRRQPGAGQRRARGRALVHARADHLRRGAGAAHAVDLVAPDRDLAARARASPCACWCSPGGCTRATAWWWPPTATSSTSARPRRWRSGRRRADPRRPRPARRRHLARPGPRSGASAWSPTSASCSGRAPARPRAGS